MIKSIVLNVNPSFLLRKVDPNKVIEDYFNGKYNTLIRTERALGTAAPAALGPAMAAQIASTPDSSIYGFRNKSNITQIIATTNCNEYLTFISEETGRPIIGGHCRHCMRDFKHEAKGVPIRIVEIEGKLIVYFVSIVCNFRCMFALWKRKYNGGSRYRDYRFADGEQIIKHLYALQYPTGSPLKEAGDPDLLKCNGGCLDDEEYDNGNYVYQPSQSIIWAPIKMQYLRFTA